MHLPLLYFNLRLRSLGRKLSLQPLNQSLYSGLILNGHPQMEFPGQPDETRPRRKRRKVEWSCLWIIQNYGGCWNGKAIHLGYVLLYCTRANRNFGVQILIVSLCQRPQFGTNPNIFGHERRTKMRIGELTRGEEASGMYVALLRSHMKPQIRMAETMREITRLQIIWQPSCRSEDETQPFRG